MEEMHCPRCGSANLHLNWVAMEWWDTDSWSCLACGHNWAGGNFSPCAPLRAPTDGR